MHDLSMHDVICALGPQGSRLTSISLVQKMIKCYFNTEDIFLSALSQSVIKKTVELLEVAAKCSDRTSK